MTVKKTEEKSPLSRYNINVFKWRVHNPVFFVSAGLIILFSATTIAFADASNQILSRILAWILDHFSWLFSLAPLVTVVTLIGLAISPVGKIRLGPEDAKPDFDFFSWIAMLFAAGVSVGYLFYGAAEPLAYYTGFGGPPLGVAPNTHEAQSIAFSATLFHWGFFAWGVYAMIGLTLAYHAYSKGAPLSIRTALHPIFGDHVWGPFGHLIDIAAALATVFGLATSIGIGAMQATSGISHLLGISSSFSTQLLIVSGVTLLAMYSVLRGVHGGVKVLSNINMFLAFGLLFFVVVVGPGLQIFPKAATNLQNYFLDAPRLLKWWGREDIDFFQDWTIFYWAWWISWSPYVGIFIARISRGRSIREYVFSVLFVPLLLSVFWFTAFGETAIIQHEKGVGAIGGDMTDMSLVLFHLLESLPWPLVTSIISIALLIFFLTTSADSGALVIDNITSGGSTNNHVSQRIFWACMVGVTTSVLLFVGGDEAVRALQAGAITTSLPFTFVLMLASGGLIYRLASDYKQFRKSRLGKR